MPTNPQTAREEIYEKFTNEWLGLDVIDPMPAIRYKGKEKADIPEGYWVRISTQLVTSDQAGFVMTEGAGQSPAAFDSYGLIFVQVFAPRKAEDSYAIGELLATAARDIFRSVETASGVWFRNTRFTEQKSTDKEWSWLVKAEYEFCERKG